MLISTSKIKVSQDRQRRDLGDIEELAASIAKFGQLQPVVIDRDHNLIAGERRLRAIQALDLPTIKAEYIDSLSPLERKLVELEENFRRKDLHWSERAKAIAEISALTNKSTRDLEILLGRAKSSIDMDLDLAQALIEMPELAAFTSHYAALRVYKTVMRSALASQLVTNTQSAQSESQSQSQSPINQKLWDLREGNCLDLIDSVPSGSVNLILTDPPFGINIDRSNRHIGSYLDSAQSLFDTIELLSPKLFSVAAPGCHVYVFCVERNFSVLNSYLLNAGFENFGVPYLVWSRIAPIQPGVHNQATWWPSHEAIIAAFKPPYRPLNSLGPVGSVLSFAPVLPSLKIHPCERPLPLLRRLIGLSAIPGDTVLDPFAGSASTLLAANQLGCPSIGFELDRSHYSVALRRLEQES